MRNRRIDFAEPRSAGKRFRTEKLHVFSAAARTIQQNDRVWLVAELYRQSISDDLMQRVLPFARFHKDSSNSVFGEKSPYSKWGAKRRFYQRICDYIFCGGGFAGKSYTVAGHALQMPLRLTIATPMLDIETEWTLNALLTTSNS